MTHRIIRLLKPSNGLRALQWPVIRELLGLFPRAVVVDLGSGGMELSRAIAQSGAFCVAIDCQPVHEPIQPKNLQPVQADVLAIPLLDGVADRVLMSSILHMVGDPSGLLREVSRILKPSGIVVVSVPAPYSLLPRFAEGSGQLLGWVRRLAGLPSSSSELVRALNCRFGVLSGRGYWSAAELMDFLASEGFSGASMRRSPGPRASLVWELVVMGGFRFGKLSFALFDVLAPALARVESPNSPSQTGEHIVSVRK